MSHLADAFYGQDSVRAMSLVTIQLATTIGSNVATQQEAHDRAVQCMADMVAAGENPPADLATKTDEYVQVVKDGYLAEKEKAEENLALPPSVQEALGINVAREEHRLEISEQWLTAIDEAWTPGGGG